MRNHLFVVFCFQPAQKSILFMLRLRVANLWVFSRWFDWSRWQNGVKWRQHMAKYQGCKCRNPKHCSLQLIIFDFYDRTFTKWIHGCAHSDLMIQNYIGGNCGPIAAFSLRWKAPDHLRSESGSQIQQQQSNEAMSKDERWGIFVRVRDWQK